MNRIFVLFLLLFSFSTFAFSQSDVGILYNNDKKHDNQSTSLEAGRWEFIMSDRMAKASFKIDKYKGDVYVIVETKEGVVLWELIHRDVNPTDKQNANAINYQLYIGGVAMKFIYLINVNTGHTWQLMESKDSGELMFESILF